MGIFLDGSENSLRNALNLIDQFSKFSGLKPNYDKTKCIWIGSKKVAQLDCAKALLLNGLMNLSHY